jgi:CheY-like chemotaxis protein
MDKERIKKIFEPFFTTKDKSKGTGLGLSTVYGIVKQNKGSVNVYSELNKGTTLKVYWPVSENEVEISDEETKSVLQKGNEVILLVEDDENVRNFSAEAIKSFGYYTYVANNAKEALDLIIKDKLIPHLLITDIIMPDMNGKELSEKVKELLPDTKILFTSGYPDNHILSKGFIEKGVHFLEKPFSLNVLSTKIRDILNIKNG